jgi:hypothetical protein
MHTQWMNGYSVPIFGLVNYIPLAATVVTCFLSVILARATLRYAEAADKGLALAREEFEREWSPELHIKLERLSTSETRIVVTNLAKISVLLQLMQLRKISHAVPFERCFLNDPLVGGTTWTQGVSRAHRRFRDFLFLGPHVPYRLVPFLRRSEQRKRPSRKSDERSRPARTRP